ncbi:peptidoglycan-recognition protein LB-like [Episyrphus balteatus]|uniref:peptidoglycan-recognition protein LB-like n=1 Tax=Episyrphus balteatus TaxID=286459 RepID=UPI0024859A3D|nr:peptidoglycan-recognition protein LB-like [Episyrphus balteatus]
MNKCLCLLSFITLLATVGAICFIVYTASTGKSESWKIISRNEWAARQPKGREHIHGPVEYVVVHHSYIPDVCNTTDACKASMRSMQDFHMDDHGWDDIGYNFAVGADGNVYVGRGFGVVGAHAPRYNNKSIGLLLIGNFMEKLPPKPMMEVAQKFIAYAVEHDHVVVNYTLYGHRQVRDTECPGTAFFAQLKFWPHWRPI